jgi:hypothetical protein
VIDIDDARGASGAQHLREQRLPLLETAAGQVEAVEVEDVEREVGESMR